MINQAIKVIGAYLPIDKANDKPAIREALNVAMDNAERQGYKVNHSFNQELAVKRVSNLIKARK
tara:strand:- start:635 stop:826 length:192 start_codon:yes stop_codon:yes gene_type:complete